MKLIKNIYITWWGQILDMFESDDGTVVINLATVSRQNVEKSSILLRKRFHFQLISLPQTQTYLKFDPSMLYIFKQLHLESWKMYNIAW